MASAVEQKKSSKKNVNKYLINAFVMLLVTAIAVVFILKDDPAEVFGYLAGSKISYILIALGIILLYYMVEGLILMVLARMYKRNYPYYKGFFNCMIGTFFSGITPSNSGGQFVQAYTFSKQGVRVSNAASILLMHFIVHQVVSVLFSAFVLIFKFEELRAYTQTIDIFGFKFEILALSVIGFSINAIIIFGLFFAAFSKKLHHFITTTGVNIMYKLHLTKDKDQKALELSTKFETFRIELKRLFQNAQILIITVILFLIKMILYNLVPYFIGLALGVGFHSANDINNIIDDFTLDSVPDSVIDQQIKILKYSYPLSVIDVSREGRDKISINTDDACISVTRLSSAFPDFFKLVPDLTDSSRKGNCHSFSPKFVMTSHLNVADTVTAGVYSLSYKGTFLHTFVETKIDGVDVVVDPTLNAIINKEGYYHLRHIKKPLERIKKHDLLNEAKIVHKMCENYSPVFQKLYLSSRLEALNLAHNILTKSNLKNSSCVEDLEK